MCFFSRYVFTQKFLAIAILEEEIQCEKVFQKKLWTLLFNLLMISLVLTTKVGVVVSHCHVYRAPKFERD